MCNRKISRYVSLNKALILYCRALKKPVGILHVKILRAYKLRKKDLIGKSDPYVKLKLSDDKLPSKKTSVKHNNLNPEWNEEFKFVIKDPENQHVELNVFDWEQACNFFRFICLCSYFAFCLSPMLVKCMIYVGRQTQQNGHEYYSVERFNPERVKNFDT